MWAPGIELRSLTLGSKCLYRLSRIYDCELHVSACCWVSIPGNCADICLCGAVKRCWEGMIRLSTAMAAGIAVRFSCGCHLSLTYSEDVWELISYGHSSAYWLLREHWCFSWLQTLYHIQRSVCNLYLYIKSLCRLPGSNFFPYLYAAFSPNGFLSFSFAYFYIFATYVYIHMLCIILFYVCF